MCEKCRKEIKKAQDNYENQRYHEYCKYRIARERLFKQLVEDIEKILSECDKK